MADPAEIHLESTTIVPHGRPFAANAEFESLSWMPPHCIPGDSWEFRRRSNSTHRFFEWIFIVEPLALILLLRFGIPRDGGCCARAGREGGGHTRRQIPEPTDASPAGDLASRSKNGGGVGGGENHPRVRITDFPAARIPLLSDLPLRRIGIWGPRESPFAFFLTPSSGSSRRHVVLIRSSVLHLRFL